jgi:Uma2 family endonuclease
MLKALEVESMYQNHPASPLDTLPTMYDLPSEDPEEMGLPSAQRVSPEAYSGSSPARDEFHDFQPDLLRETCLLPAIDEYFVGVDLNLYYDSKHTSWYKRPDWFLVLGVPASTSQQDLRLSYVLWQEGVAPFVMVELLSPGTEAEDLGQTLRVVGKPPTKWQVKFMNKCFGCLIMRFLIGTLVSFGCFACKVISMWS